MTNALKQFKWRPRGKRRIHQPPNQTEIQACRPWLEQELELVAPATAGLLGAVAAKARIRAGLPRYSCPRPGVGRHRGRLAWPGGGHVHPSSILRAPDAEAWAQAFAAFVADLEVTARRLGH